jgi:YidC/Oxa1 family membrane protein insertase
MTLSFAVLYGWTFYQQYTNPPKAPATQPVAQATATQPSTGPQSTISAAGPAEATSQPIWHVQEAPRAQTVTLGQDTELGTYQIQAFLTNRGAAVERVLMVGKEKAGKKMKYRFAESVKEDGKPYEVITPLVLPNGDQEVSWQTASIRIGNPEVTLPLANVHWNVETSRTDDGGFVARFWIDVYNADQPVVRITKRFTLAPGSFAMNMDLTFQPLADQEVQLVVDQLGALGIRREDPRSDFRKIYVVVENGKTRLRPETFQHAGLVKKGAVDIGSASPIAWTALVDKYFAAITAPEKVVGGSKVINSARVFTYTRDAQAQDLGGDIGVKLLSPALTATTDAPAQLCYDLFVGPKTVEALSATEAYSTRNYGLLRSAEYAWCTFSSLGELLTSFLHWLYYYIPPHNYGVAIIILVLLVRLMLHPLTKHQQVVMAQMQQKQASVQPKIAAAKTKFANDKQKLQLETMRIYREAGINPAGQIAGCLPMLIQLPIWVALYSALSNDINLWHAPFVSWINDLSAPDALISWNSAVNIPILSWILGPVDKFNLLPILLSVSMWLQQKLMPKPTPAPGTPPEQIAQQQQMQKMMGFMMIFMGIMFYNMPSGLNLYIMASSAFGALESHRIRKHMEERKKDPNFGKPKEGGWMAKLMEHVEKKAATTHTLRKDKDE